MQRCLLLRIHQYFLPKHCIKQYILVDIILRHIFQTTNHYPINRYSNDIVYFCCLL